MTPSQESQCASACLSAIARPFRRIDQPGTLPRWHRRSCLDSLIDHANTCSHRSKEAWHIAPPDHSTYALPGGSSARSTRMEQRAVFPGRRYRNAGKQCSYPSVPTAQTSHRNCCSGTHRWACDPPCVLRRPPSPPLNLPSTSHLCAAFGALFLVTGHAHHVRLAVPTTRTDTVATRSGSLGASHTPGATSTTPASSTPAPASTATTCTHLIHLLPLTARARVGEPIGLGILLPSARPSTSASPCATATSASERTSWAHCRTQPAGKAGIQGHGRALQPHIAPSCLSRPGNLDCTVPFTATRHRTLALRSCSIKSWHAIHLLSCSGLLF